MNIFNLHSIPHGTAKNNSLPIYTHTTHTHTLSPLFQLQVHCVLYGRLPVQQSGASYLAPHQQDRHSNCRVGGGQIANDVIRKKIA